MAGHCHGEALDERFTRTVAGPAAEAPQLDAKLDYGPLPRQEACAQYLLWIRTEDRWHVGQQTARDADVATIHPPQYLSTSTVRDQRTIDFLSASFPSPFVGLDPTFGSTISRAALLRPYPQFSSVVMTGTLRPPVFGFAFDQQTSNLFYQVISTRHSRVQQSHRA